MRKYPKTAVMFLAALIVVLSGTNASSLVIAGYFPMHQGNFWIFENDTTGETETWTINGSIYLLNIGNVFILSRDDGTFLFLRQDGNGTAVYGIFEPRSFFIPDFPLLFMPRDINLDPAADPIASTATLDIYTDPTDTKQLSKAGIKSMTVSFTTAGYDTVTIDGHEYVDCIAIKRKISSPKGSITETLWLAPSIGPVKRVVKKNGGRTQSYSLVSALGTLTKKESFSLRDYFSLEPGTTWTYKDESGNIRQNKTTAYEKARLTATQVMPYIDYTEDIHYLAFDERGLIMPQRYWAAYGGLTAYPPPAQCAVILPAVLQPGQWHLSRSCPRSYKPRTMIMGEDTHPELEYSSVILGTEDVTVPAGTFRDCIKISTSYISRNFTIYFDALRVGYIWLAPGKGIVKEQAVSMYNYAFDAVKNSILDVRYWELLEKKCNGMSDAVSPSPIEKPERQTMTSTPKLTTRSTQKDSVHLDWKENSKAMFEKVVVD